MNKLLFLLFRRLTLCNIYSFDVGISLLCTWFAELGAYCVHGVHVDMCDAWALHVPAHLHDGWPHAVYQWVYECFLSLSIKVSGK